MKVTKANRHTALCGEMLRPPASARNGHSRSWAYRCEKAKRAGRDPCQCATPSAYIIDGAPRCLNHAGQMALAHLMEQG